VQKGVNLLADQGIQPRVRKRTGAVLRSA